MRMSWMARGVCCIILSVVMIITAIVDPAIPFLEFLGIGLLTLLIGIGFCYYARNKDKWKK